MQTIKRTAAGSPVADCDRLPAALFFGVPDRALSDVCTVREPYKCYIKGMQVSRRGCVECSRKGEKCRTGKVGFSRIFVCDCLADTAIVYYLYALKS